MSTKSEISNAEPPITGATKEEGTGIWPVVWLGLAPLIWLAMIGVAEVVLLSLIRQSMDPSDFLLQQQIFLMVMIGGLTVAIIAYTVTMSRALRRIESWQQNGHRTRARAGLIAITLDACIVVLPLVLTLFFHSSM